MNCEVARCRRPMLITYAAFNGHTFKPKTGEVRICQHHWSKHCDDNDKFDIRNHFNKGARNDKG